MTGQVRLVIRGENGGFCAGGDIAEYPSFRFNPPYDYATSAEHREGISAFLEKGPPRFP